LINAERDRPWPRRSRRSSISLDGLAGVYTAAGERDRWCPSPQVRMNEDLANLVTENLIAVKGITKTTTLIAFRQYSRHDLERVFGLGM
jgi:hypothetical protein